MYKLTNYSSRTRPHSSRTRTYSSLTRRCFLLGLSALSFFLVSIGTAAQQWIPIPQEAKPYTRWWWLGSAVDSVGLEANLMEFAKVGIGGVEITPIYGVKGNDAHEIPYLSPRWMQMLQYVEERGAA